ncbi:MAG TPA: YiiD C-terminal domain-containing protein [Gammaproteobacteria bacterium]|nr:YiiD C-terminal domain-containing protein [Gammaproteobacteria bacterium]
MPPDTAPIDWPACLRDLWAKGIPLAGEMGVAIQRLDEHVLAVTAPLAPNRNHMGSAFGGSLQGLATLAGWGVALLAVGAPDSHHVVIRHAQMRFILPVSGELVAEAALPSAGAIAAFRGTLADRGYARLSVPVIIRGPGESIAARYVGEFVALAAERQAGANVPDPKPGA